MLVIEIPAYRYIPRLSSFNARFSLPVLRLTSPIPGLENGSSSSSSHLIAEGFEMASDSFGVRVLSEVASDDVRREERGRGRRSRSTGVSWGTRETG